MGDTNLKLNSIVVDNKEPEVLFWANYYPENSYLNPKLFKSEEDAIKECLKDGYPVKVCSQFKIKA